MPLDGLGAGKEAPPQPGSETGSAGEWEEEARPGLAGSWKLAGSQGDSVQTGRTGWGWSSWRERQEAGPGPEWSFLASQSLSRMDFPWTSWKPSSCLGGFCSGVSVLASLSCSPPQLGLLSDILTMFGVPLLTPTPQPLLTSHLYLFSVSPIPPTCQCSFCSILSLLTGFRPSHYLILRGKGPQGDLR